MRKPCMDPRIDAWHSRGAGAPPGLGGDVPPHLQGELLPKQRLLRPQPCLSASETPWPAPFPSATLPPASATASFPPFNLNKTELFFFFFPLAGTGWSCNISPLGSLGSHDTTFTHRPDYHHRALFLFSQHMARIRQRTRGAHRPQPVNSQ